MLPWLKDISLHFTYFGVFLALLLAIAEWLKKEKGKPPSALFFTALCVASLQWRIALLLSKEILKVPQLAFLLPSTLFLTGPFVFKLALKMIEFTYETKKSFYWHLLPAWIAFFYDIYFQTLDKAEQIHILNQSLYLGKFTWLNIGLFLGTLHVAFYFFWMLVLNGKLKKEFDLRFTKLVKLILITPLVGILLFAFRIMMPTPQLMWWAAHVGAATITLSVVLVLLFLIKYPSFFESLQAKIQKQKYESTHLQGLDIEAIKNRLKELMEVQQLFLDENLRLADLADECLVTKHQMSRILNEHYGKNFNEFINTYRVEEAKKKLMEKPEQSVLTIGYEVGFNTKSTFNTHFLKITGMTPAAYRRKYRK